MTRNCILTSSIVVPHESGNAWYSTVRSGVIRNTVHIHTIRNAQVPIIVPIAGARAWPLPRSAPAGISYRLQSGSNSKMHRIRTEALAIIADSEVNNPDNEVRNSTIVKIGMELHTMEHQKQRNRIFLHLPYCSAAWFWLVKVVVVCPKAVMI